MLDAGVLVGLAWGTFATVVACVAVLRAPHRAGDPEVPARQPVPIAKSPIRG